MKPRSRKTKKPLRERNRVRSSAWIADVLEELNVERRKWDDLANIEATSLGGNMVKQAQYAGSAAGLAIAICIVNEKSAIVKGQAQGEALLPAPQSQATTAQVVRFDELLGFRPSKNTENPNKTA